MYHSSAYWIKVCYIKSLKKCKRQSKGYSYIVTATGIWIYILYFKINTSMYIAYFYYNLVIVYHYVISYIGGSSKCHVFASMDCILYRKLQIWSLVMEFNLCSPQTSRGISTLSHIESTSFNQPTWEQPDWHTTVLHTTLQLFWKLFIYISSLVSSFLRMKMNCLGMIGS